MSDSPTPFFDLITRQVELWREQRAELQRQIDEIDSKVANAARTLGISADEVAAAMDLPRLPRRGADARSKGSMAQFIRDFMSTAERGYTRTELKAAIRAANPRFAEMINRNENGFYNTIKRLIKGEKSVVDIDGVLYDAQRAPEDEGEATLLPENVTLFSPVKQEG